MIAVRQWRAETCVFFNFFSPSHRVASDALLGCRGPFVVVRLSTPLACYWLQMLLLGGGTSGKSRVGAAVMQGKRWCPLLSPFFFFSLLPMCADDAVSIQQLGRDAHRAPSCFVPL